MWKRDSGKQSPSSDRTFDPLQAAAIRLQAMLAVFDEELAVPASETSLSAMELRADLNRPEALRTLERGYASIVSHEQVAQWTLEQATQTRAAWSRRLMFAVDAGAHDKAAEAATRLRASEVVEAQARDDFERWQSLVREYETAMAALRN